MMNDNKNDNKPTFGVGEQHLFIRFPTLAGQFGLENKVIKGIMKALSKSVR